MVFIASLVLIRRLFHNCDRFDKFCQTNASIRVDSSGMNSIYFAFFDFSSSSIHQYDNYGVGLSSIHGTITSYNERGIIIQET